VNRLEGNAEVRPAAASLQDLSPDCPGASKFYPVWNLQGQPTRGPILRGGATVTEPTPMPQDLRELLEQGATFAEIASRFHLSGEELWKRLKQSKLESRKRGAPTKVRPKPEQELQISAAFKSGKFVSQIAREFSVSPQLVY